MTSKFKSGYFEKIKPMTIVRAADGEQISLEAIIGGKPLVIWFLRRLGCQICRWSTMVTV